MKSYLHVLILLLIADFVSAQGSFLSYSSTIQVAPFTFDNTRPRIVLTNNNIPVVMWGRGSNKNIYTARFNGIGFDTPVSHTPGSVQAFVTDWASAEMAAIGDTVFIVYKSEPALTGGIFLTKSVNGGISFSDTVRVENIDPYISRFANIAVAPGGNPVVTFMKFEPGWYDPQYSIIQSYDGGSTFLPDVVATSIAPGEACDCCPASLAIEGNRQIVLFRNNISNLRNMWAVLSDDGGQSFSSASEIDQSNWYLGVCPSSGPEGFVYGDSMVYTWMSGASNSYRVYFGTVNINDWQVGINNQISPAGGISQNMPRIAGNADTLAIVWEQINGINRYIMMSWSIQGPAGLGINIDTVATSTISVINPDIEFSSGVFHISYQDGASSTVHYKTASVTTVTGITENNDVNNVLIYPNPAKDELNIKLNVPAEDIFITDINGKILKSLATKDSNISINTSNFKPGVYLIKINSKTEKSIQKLFIIE